MYARTLFTRKTSKMSVRRVLFQRQGTPNGLLISCNFQTELRYLHSSWHGHFMIVLRTKHHLMPIKTTFFVLYDKNTAYLLIFALVDGILCLY